MPSAVLRTIKRSWQYDPLLVLYLPLYALDGASFKSKDARGTLCTASGAIWSRQGRIYDGVDDVITVASSANLKLTDGAGNDVAGGWWAWIKPTNFAAARAVFAKSDAVASREYTLLTSITTGTLLCRLYTDSDNYIDQTSNTGLTAGASVFVGATYTGSEVNTGIVLYKDGLPFASTAGGAGSYTGMPAATGSLRIGNRDTALDLDFLGTIGEFGMIRGRTPTAGEMMNKYLATKWRYQ